MTVLFHRHRNRIVIEINALVVNDCKFVTSRIGPLFFSITSVIVINNEHSAGHIRFRIHPAIVTPRLDVRPFYTSIKSRKKTHVVMRVKRAKTKVARETQNVCLRPTAANCDREAGIREFISQVPRLVCTE